MKHPIHWAALALSFNALVWGLAWWPFRALKEAGLHPLWATALIYSLGVLCLLAWRPGAWRHLRAHPGLWWLVLAAGGTNVGFNWALTIEDVVRVVLLFYLMPAWTLLLGWWLLGERPSGAGLLRLALALGGVVVVLQVPGQGWPVPSSLGDALAIFGGFGFALTNVLLRQQAHTPETGRMLAMFFGGAVLPGAVALVGSLQGWVTGLPAPQLGWLILALGLAVMFLLGNVALQYGAARLAASTTALVLLSEIVFASVSSVLLGASELGWRTVLGGALILAAAVWAALEGEPAGAAADDSPGKS
jgi:drug/metabolite transporter (DMT)-like permease